MKIASLVLVIWLVIGAVAGGQRHYYNGSAMTCVHAGTIALTVVAGPLNYFGVNPKTDCQTPQPSS
jgi:hypothetical protein